MKPDDVPAAGVPFWAALSAASVFGADCGDTAAHVLGLGHVRGLPFLAAAFALVLLAERRAGFRTVAFYWAAIVLLRTAATNAADFLTHDLRLGFGTVSAVLALLTAAFAAAHVRHAVRDGTDDGKPPVGWRYWIAMALAGTLGTVGGDGLAGRHGLALGTADATLLLLPPLVLASGLALRSRARGTALALYWIAVVLIRTAGTTFGDWSADGIGLLPATGLAGATLVVLAATASRRRDGLAAGRLGDTPLGSR